MFDFSTPVNRYGTYCTQWDYVQDRFGEADLLPFTISDMDFETAPCIQRALQQRLAHGVLGYSRWNHDDFKQAIAGWFAKRYQAELDPQSLVYGPSVIYIIAQLITLWSQPGEGVLVHTPAYDAFGNMLKANQRKLLASPLLKTEQGYEIDWPQFEQQAAREECKILLFCSPHNPTGRVWHRDELTRMAEICQRHNVKVISDDIHMDMAYSTYLPWSEVALSNNWALVSSGSKSFNIPALTGAYAFIPEQQSREQYLIQLKAAHGLSSPSILGIIAHITAYQQGGDWLDSLKGYLQQNLLTVAERLNSAFPAINYQVPDGTYLAWVDLNPLDIDMDALQHILIHKHKVAIMRGDTYGEEGKGYIRLNVGCPRSKVEAGLDALIAAIRQLRD
ncbi:bifunctional beta-cystathionase/maltose regulon regulatory protein [Photobacterium gaetbulicola]|uniref:cysteine-S-conjugate beta-lyase n=1 Tax=Photobacterium gaetbulicola TaxID=1295392 RepID=A0A0B9GIF5_9GAMM|nr:MalY/PatB family protein [Photobacterium gaetbulicola]KHT58761.1 bifunctional beta-cystathionase/maltose regulon regulatory protein [Photobacterium gaetbulicola]